MGALIFSMFVQLPSWLMKPLTFGSTGFQEYWRPIFFLPRKKFTPQVWLSLLTNRSAEYGIFTSKVHPSDTTSHSLSHTAFHDGSSPLVVEYFMSICSPRGVT